MKFRGSRLQRIFRRREYDDSGELAPTEEHDTRYHLPRSRAWGAAFLVAGIGIFLGLELLEEPDATSWELFLELVEVAAIVLVSAGVVLFLGDSRGRTER